MENKPPPQSGPGAFVALPQPLQAGPAAPEPKGGQLLPPGAALAHRGGQRR